MDREIMAKSLNRAVTGDGFVNKDTNNYIYASISQPPLQIVNKNGKENELDYTVKCPTCGNEVNYGNELFMLSGHHYCVKDGCREKLTYLLGARLE